MKKKSLVDVLEIPAGVWVHVTVTRSEVHKGYDVYANRVLMGSINKIKKFRLNPVAASDLFRIFNRKLSEQEIELLFKEYDHWKDVKFNKKVKLKHAQVETKEMQPLQGFCAGLFTIREGDTASFWTKG